MFKKVVKLQYRCKQTFTNFPLFLDLKFFFAKFLSTVTFI